jgi:hypothetical protein
LAAGTAETPYQLRVLLPWLVQELLRLGLPDTAIIGTFQVLEFFSILFLVIAFRAYLSLFLTTCRWPPFWPLPFCWRCPLTCCIPIGILTIFRPFSSLPSV